MSDNKICITRILNDDVKTAVYMALDLIDAKNLFTKPNMKILIKPNSSNPKVPERAVTTHPAIIKAVIQWLKKKFSPKKNHSCRVNVALYKLFCINYIKKKGLLF